VSSSSAFGARLRREAALFVALPRDCAARERDDDEAPRLVEAPGFFAADLADDFFAADLLDLADDFLADFAGLRGVGMVIPLRGREQQIANACT
jgi:hypothetical protein